eukprot:TRINITY_DN1355_c0_g5_i1.p1 TRINITY_DN1355_c0_g5~~TRINITY_DN1355_c0_g5_i1.p1  ORF type:complete len:553 (+),score=165.23 TRINITY_DN1355_c0_g5_i1:24-1661(+)
MPLKNNLFNFVKINNLLNSTKIISNNKKYNTLNVETIHSQNNYMKTPNLKLYGIYYRKPITHFKEEEKKIILKNEIIELLSINLSPQLNLLKNTLDRVCKSKDDWIEVNPYEKISLPNPNLKKPQLKHGLQHCIDKPGLYLMHDPNTKQLNFDYFLSKIPHPDKINKTVLPVFVPSSKDTKLENIAKQNNCNFVASTSSTCSVLSTLYLSLSNFAKPNFTSLPTFSDKFGKRHFMPHVYKPSGVLVTKANVIGLDSLVYQEKNNILSEMGVPIEYMLLTNPDEYKNTILSTSNNNRLEQDSFNYLKSNDFLFRSQIDCFNKSNLDHSFDIKSRASADLRLEVGTGRPRSLKNKPFTSIIGATNSFEKEFFDLIRGTLLKYFFQANIGKMKGVFMVYHDIISIYGFEYLPINEIATHLFGNNATGDYVFNFCIELWQNIIKTICLQTKSSKFRVLIRPARLSLQIVVEEIEDDLINPFTKVGKITRYFVHFELLVNGEKRSLRNIEKDSVVKLFYKILDVTTNDLDAERILYFKMLEQSGIFHKKI